MGRDSPRLDSPSGGGKGPIIGKRVTFANSVSEVLVGSLVDKGSRHVAILCHGYASSKDSQLMQGMARELAAKDLSTLRFDFSGNGEYCRNSDVQ